MSSFIEDGTGSGKLAKVDSDNRLQTFTVSQERLEEQLIEGNSYYVSAGAVDFLGGSTGTTEYVMFEFKNTTTNDLMVVSPQVWISPAHTTGPYAESTDQYVRFNQWLSSTAYLDSSGDDSINENLNATSSKTLPLRTNSNNAVRKADQADAVATPAKTSAAGYICGFLGAHGANKIDMLPTGQNLVIGAGQCWIVSCKPVQNSSPTNHIIGCRASVVDLGA